MKNKSKVNTMAGIVVVYILMMISQFVLNMMFDANIETYWPFGFVIHSIFAVPVSIMIIIG